LALCWEWYSLSSSTAIEITIRTQDRSVPVDTLDLSSLELVLNLLALFLCSVAVYTWDEVYGITKKGKISGGWVYLIVATIFAVVGIYPGVASFFYEIQPDFERTWVLLSKVVEGLFLMIAGIVFYNTIYRSLRTQDVSVPTEPEPEKPSPDRVEAGVGGRAERYGISTEELLTGLLARLNIYWGPDVSRQMLIQSLQGRVDERDLLRVVADFLPMTDEEKWKQKWAQ
jgi:hypothetical protein